jgi:small subunit ribosomal protein S17
MKKDIGVGVNPPENECQDPACAWHGKIAVRGRVFEGRVRSSKSHNTVIVEWAYTRFIPKYESYERRKSRVSAHNPPCIRAREGDNVVIYECRPISKTKKFIVVADLGKASIELRGEEQRIAMKEKPKKEEAPAEEPREEPRPEAKPAKRGKQARREIPKEGKAPKKGGKK